MIVPQEGIDLFDAQPRLLAPGADGVAEAVPADIPQTSRPCYWFDVALEQPPRPVWSLPLRVQRGEPPGRECGGDRAALEAPLACSPTQKIAVDTLAESCFSVNQPSELN